MLRAMRVHLHVSQQPREGGINPFKEEEDCSRGKGMHEGSGLTKWGLPM